MAEAREPTHPDDSIDIYRNVLVATVEATSNGRYDGAVNLVRKIGSVLGRMERSSQFLSEINQLRIVFKRKRNFVVELDRMEREARSTKIGD